MSDLPICDIRLDKSCGVCYKCQIEKDREYIEYLELQLESCDKEYDKVQKQLKEANRLLDEYVDITMDEIKFPEFDHARCEMSRKVHQYNIKYKDAK